MKKKLHTSIVGLCFIASLLFGPSALAQDQIASQTGPTSVPNLIRYSGVLKDANSSLLASQTVGVTFSIYKEAEGGVALWHEVRNVTTDASGQYNILLGSTMTEGVPPELFSDQEQRWLSVQMEGRPEQPRVLLVSVPYAFKAREAETLGGLPASAFLKAPTADLTSTASAQTGAALTGLSTVANLGTASQTAGTSGKNKAPCPPGTNHILYWDSTNDICPSAIIQDPGSGNIGIGTNSPSEPLDVNGQISSSRWYDIGEPETRILSVHNNASIVAPANSTNLFVGWDTGSSNIGDLNNNTFMGRGAGPANTTGHDNTFSGYQAGNATVGGNEPAGSYNSFAGSQAGLLNTTGYMNTFHGYTAGFGNTTGSQNSCLGSAACLHNLTGVQNVALGAGAGFRNTNGSANVYVGFDSGWGVTGIGPRGSNNTMTGWQTGFDNFGSNNVFYGYQAGFSNTTGSSNIAIGAGAGSTAGAANSNNIYIGNPGTNETGPAIRIGIQGAPHINQTYIGGIVTNLFGVNSGAQFVLIDNTGHLGVSGASLLGPVTGSCSLGVNFLTKWSNNSTVECTHVWENAAYPYWVGIGPNSNPNPLEQLDVRGEINAGDANTQNNHYRIGDNVVLSIEGTNNLFSGVGAGTASSSTNSNTFTGFNAGNVNTANGNSFYGFQSGAANISGIQNVFAGYKSGVVNSTGHSNTFIGFNAGQANITESYSTFLGANAGFNSTVGGNTFLGYSSGSNTDVGYGNVGTGYDAGRSNQDGILNAYYGVNAGFNGSLTNFTHGSYNTFLGNGAGSTSGLVNGSNNIFVGFAAGNAETDVSNSIEIGNTGATNYGNGSIQIGTLNSQINQTYVQGIFTYPTPNVTTFVTVQANGHLGVATPVGGGGNVNGPVNCGANFLTKWAGGGPNVDCSHVVEETTSGGYHVGIAGAPGNAQLDVIGDLGNINTTNTRSSYMVGYDPVLSVYPTNTSANLFVGVGAGAVTMATHDTFSGYLSGTANTVGVYNAFYGSHAGDEYNESGPACTYPSSCGFNTFLGSYAGHSHLSGSDNTFLGYIAGNNHTTGNYNIYVGDSSGSNVFSGDGSILIGVAVGCNVTPCDNQIVIGNGLATDTYVAGIFNKSVGVNPAEVCIDSNGKLGTVGCPSSGPSQKQQAALESQQNDIQSLLARVAAQQQEISSLKSQLQVQNAAFQERLSRLESVLSTQVASTSTTSSAASAPNGGQ